MTIDVTSGAGTMHGIPDSAAIDRAARLLAQHLPRTRLVTAAALPGLGQPLLLKLECELPTGSFKVRGALYALSCAVGRGSVSGVTAASTGNHGAAVAWAARVLGVPATIFLPDNPNPVKRGRILEHGAAVVEAGADIAAARMAAEAFADRHGALLLDDATNPDLPAGPATIAREVLEQRPGVRTFIVPIGDTALIRGVAAVARAHDCRVIGVQAAAAPAYEQAWRTGRAEATAGCATIADGLATRVPDAGNVAAIRSVVDDVVLVTDEQMLDAMRLLLLHEQLHAEPSGAAAVAAALRLDPGPEAVALITGSNSPAHVLARLLGAPARTHVAVRQEPAARPEPAARQGAAVAQDA